MPTLDSKKKPGPAIKDDYDFDLDDIEDINEGNNQKDYNYMDKYSKAQKLMSEHEEEENKGFKMRVNAPPGGNNNQSSANDDYSENYEEDYIEEEI